MSNGSTAIEGLSSEGGPPASAGPRGSYHHQPAATDREQEQKRQGRGRRVHRPQPRRLLPAAVRATSPGATRQTSTGSAMFLTRCRPAGSKRKASLPLTWLCTLRGDADPARLGQRLQPRGDVHPVAEMSPPSWIDVAEVDADAEADALGLGDARLPLGHAALDRDRAGDRVDGAGELAEDAVAHELDDAAAVLGDERLDELLAVGLEALEGALLVALHEARVADHVRRQDGGEPAVDAGSGHGAALLGASDGAMLSEMRLLVRLHASVERNCQFYNSGHPIRSEPASSRSRG